MEAKKVFLIILIVLFCVVLLQNTQVVTMRFLFWRAAMSQIILLPLILLAGFAAGYFAGKRSW